MSTAWRKYRSKEITAGPIDKVHRRHNPVSGDVVGYQVQIYPGLWDLNPLEPPKYDSIALIDVPPEVFASGMPRNGDYLIQCEEQYRWVPRLPFEQIFEPTEKDNDDADVPKP